MGSWNELEEDSAVDWKISACSKADASNHRSNADKICASSRGQSKGGGNEESQIECQLSSHKICANTPKRGANDQTSVQSKSQERFVGRVEFLADLGEDDCNSLQPQIVRSLAVRPVARNYK